MTIKDFDTKKVILEDQYKSDEYETMTLYFIAPKEWLEGPSAHQEYRGFRLAEDSNRREQFWIYRNQPRRIECNRSSFFQGRCADDRTD